MSEVRTNPRYASVCLLDVRQVAELLGLSERSVWRMAACDELPRPVRIGARLQRWRLTDLERWLAKRRGSTS